MNSTGNLCLPKKKQDMSSHQYFANNRETFVTLANYSVHELNNHFYLNNCWSDFNTLTFTSFALPLGYLKFLAVEILETSITEASARSVSLE